MCERENRIRVYRADELQYVHITNDHFERPLAFNLAEYWENWCAVQKGMYSSYIVTVRVAAKMITELPNYIGSSIRAKIAQSDLPDSDGRIKLTVSFNSLEDARSRLLSFGKAIEVLEPLALRLSIADYSRQITELYDG